MSGRRFVRSWTRRRARDWAEVARWLNLHWACRCRYSNVASYRCYYCGSRAPVEVRAVLARTLETADRVVGAPEAAADAGAR